MVNRQKKVLIIGGGIAGLSAGCYGQMNGYETRILELHTLPGGLCTGWKRKDYWFNYCIHWLSGTKPDTAFYDIWNQIGALDNTSVHYYNEFCQIKDENGKALTIYTDLQKLEEHLKEIAPEDGICINEMIRAIRKLESMKPPDKPVDIMGLVDIIKLIRSIQPIKKEYQKYCKMSVEEFALQFKNPFLRRMFSKIINLPNFPLLCLFSTLSGFDRQSSGWPMGGSLSFAQRIEKRYKNLGGTIDYNKKVTRILVRKKKAVGVMLEDGTEMMADIIISAADGHTTLTNLLDGTYTKGKLKKLYTFLDVYPGMLMVFLGLNRDMSEEVHNTVYIGEHTLGGQTIKDYTIRHFCFDKSIAPGGKTSIVLMAEVCYDYWKDLYNSKRESYYLEKKAVLKDALSLFEKHYPGISEDIEVADVCTPVTAERYTNNWKGSYEGFKLTPDTMRIRLKKSLPGLKGFYMIGQWTTPGGGVPPAALDGKYVFQIICKKDRRKFVSRAE